jgi:hypothetical protein
VPGRPRANPRGYPRRLWAPPRRHYPAPLGVRSPILPYWLYFHTDKKRDPEARGHYWIDSPAGEAIKRLCFTEDGALLENASVGTAARRAAPCKITAVVRRSLEQHCYVQVMRFVDLKEYNYVLTSAAVRFGDPHALMQPRIGRMSPPPACPAGLCISSTALTSDRLHQHC